LKPELELRVERVTERGVNWVEMMSMALSLM
jgi:hypothetical protein